VKRQLASALVAPPGALGGPASALGLSRLTDRLPWDLVAWGLMRRVTGILREMYGSNGAIGVLPVREMQ
jgi:hypothetical protein